MVGALSLIFRACRKQIPAIIERIPVMARRIPLMSARVLSGR